MSHHPPRKSCSVANPRDYYNNHNQQHDNPDMHNKPFEGYHPGYHQYPHSSHQQQQYYQQPMYTGEQRLVEDIPFEPPNIDLVDNHAVHQAPNYMAGPAMMPPHAYPMHHHQQMTHNWQQHNNQRFFDRKSSLPAAYQSVHNKQIPHANPQMMNYNPVVQNGQMLPVCYEEHNGMSNNKVAMQIPMEPQRKITPVLRYNQMLSPPTATSQLPCGSHVQSPALSSPMEIDRKPSDRFMSKFSRDETPRHDYKVPERKASCMAAKSILRCQQDGPVKGQQVKYTPPPILNPMRYGPGLFCSISRSNSTVEKEAPGCIDENEMPTAHNDSDDTEMSDGSPGLKLEESSPEMVGNGRDWAELDQHPRARKNGLAFMATQMCQFTHELEALRKASNESDMSHHRMEDRLPHASGINTRKESNVSEFEDTGEIEVPEMKNDKSPHINFDRPDKGKPSNYQATVNKWNPLRNEVTLDEINFMCEDRDVQLFNPECVEQLSNEQISAYENLACSEAGNQPGFNKELALHFLSEHRGNLCSAVSDVLTCSNTLDWESFYNIKYNDYPEAAEWTPDELIIFEDSMFQFKKDFVQVKQNLPNKTVRECVEFYYTWKKASPEAYTKLKKNLRAQLGLEQALNSMSRLSTAEPYRGIEDYKDPNIKVNTNDNIFSMPNSVSPLRDYQGMFPNQSTPSPNNYKDITGYHKAPYHTTRPMVSSSGKKGAQPSSDGLFHCAKCEKSFEKVKSLNAHMKSHAMKERAEKEAKSQVEQQMNQVAQPQMQMNINGVNGVNPFSNGLAAMNLQQLAQGLANSQNNMPHLAQFQNLLNAQGSLNGLLNGNNQLISQITGHQPIIH